LGTVESKCPFTWVISSNRRHLTWPAAIWVEVVWELFRIQALLCQRWMSHD
jgi:hypothetical protein